MSDETNDPQEELTEEQMALKEQATKEYFAEIMEQLLQSERFVRFFRINYDVQTYIDEEAKTYNTRVIELPPVLASERLKQLAAEHAEENMPMVQTATMEEIKALAGEKDNGR